MQKNPLLSVERRGDVAIARTTTSTLRDTVEVGEFERELNRLVDEEGASKLVLNLATIKLLSSSVLSVLVRINRKTKAAGGGIKLCHVNRDTMEVLRVMRLTKIFDVCDTEERAVEGFAPAP